MVFRRRAGAGAKVKICCLDHPSQIPPFFRHSCTGARTRHHARMGISPAGILARCCSHLEAARDRPGDRRRLAASPRGTFGVEGSPDLHMHQRSEPSAQGAELINWIIWTWRCADASEGRGPRRKPRRSLLACAPTTGAPNALLQVCKGVGAQWNALS